MPLTVMYLMYIASVGISLLNLMIQEKCLGNRIQSDNGRMIRNVNLYSHRPGARNIAVNYVQLEMNFQYQICLWCLINSDWSLLSHQCPGYAKADETYLYSKNCYWRKYKSFLHVN